MFQIYINLAQLLCYPQFLPKKLLIHKLEHINHGKQPYSDNQLLQHC